MNFKALYANFDGLDIAFQGVLPEETLRLLAEAKEYAQQHRSEDIIEIAGISMRVAESGGGGGYAFRFDTGEDGATWFVKNTTNQKEWAIRVSAKSLALALHGYAGVKAEILSVLKRLGAMGKSRACPLTGKVTNFPLESISRFDYCIDFHVDHFVPNTDHFLTHSRSTKHTHQKVKLTTKDTVTRGDTIESVRIGKMPNKQIALYNKIAEIRHSHKAYWWKLWDIKPEAFDGMIWRLELRAGKDELGKWDAKTFDQFEKKASNVATHILESIRYVVPSSYDSNVSRWPDHVLWEAAHAKVGSGLYRYKSQDAKRDGIMTGLRNEKISQLNKQADGLAVGLAAALNVEMDDIPRILEEQAKRIKGKLFAQRREMEEKYLKALRKYSLLH